MASEIRVDKINSLSGVGTVTLSPTGVDIAGITTAATLRATTGIVTSLTTGSLTSLGAVSGTTGTFTSTVNSGTTATGTIFSVGDSGNSGDRAIQFKRAATTNDINIQAINSGSGGTNLLFNQEGGAASFGGAISATTGTFTGDVDIADKIVHTGDTNTAIRFPSADTITAETGGSERLRIDSSGKIIAGSTSSRGIAGGYAKLQVEATSSEGISLTRTSNDGGAVYLSFGKTRNGSVCQAGDNIGSISWNPDDGTDLNHAAAEIQTLVASGIGGDDVPGDLVFKTNGGATTTTERLRITSDGKVGINQSSPQKLLDVYNSSTNESNIYVRNASVNYLVRTLSDQVQAGSETNHPFYAISNNQYVARFDGDGVKFGSDSAAANALDDYEEGTFTPTLPNGTSLTNSGSYYVKIGRFVNFYCYITSLNIPNNSSAFRVGGLPFTVLNGMYGGPCSISYTGAANDSRMAALAPNTQTNDSYIYFHTTGIGEAFILTNAHFQPMSGGNLNIQGCYMTAS